MGRQEEALRIAEEVLADVELKRLKASEIVLKASRLARLVGQSELIEFLALERDGYPGNDTDNYWIGRAGRWSGASKEKFFPASIAKIESEIEAARQALGTLSGGGNYSGEYASVAAREHDKKIASYSSTLSTFSGISGQVVATVYSLVTELYHELLFSELQATLFEATQARVDGALAASSGMALEKMERISDRLRDGDAESVSQGLTSCRRLIDSVADHLFRSNDGDYDLGDGARIKIGQQNVLNRLQAYCHQQGLSKSRRDRIRKTLVELYARCSAGTHAEVDVQEARFVFLQTYVVLGEILTLGTEPEKLDKL
ncbi:hypothetical protein [Arthrobacter sp. NPDC093139]|uniref:AbiTii domain-containing protein n=1 Tax=Arthrobacter sp. NPDC093139 TaxID=3363945 RepID=UPI00380C72DF